MNATTLRERLQQGPALEALAALGVDALLDSRADQWVPAQALGGQARRLLEGWLDAPGATAVLGRVVEATVHRLSHDRRTLKDVLPRELKHAVREVVGRPFSPDRKLVLALIDRPPTRELARQILLTAVLDFARRASAPMAGMAKGLGALARFAGETVTSRGGGLGSLVGAVGSEVERQLEKRASEFVDTALAGVFAQLADAVADPKRASEAAELRVALFDGALELSGPQLARELVNLDLPGATEVLRAGLKRWLATPQAQTSFDALAAQVGAASAGARSVRTVLTELGVLEVARALAVEQATAGLRALVGTPAFAAWLEALVAE